MVTSRARAEALAAWAQSLARAARYDEHPWNEALLIEALVAEGSSSWQEVAAAGAKRARAAATLGQ